jgi:hypothetical protein
MCVCDLHALADDLVRVPTNQCVPVPGASMSSIAIGADVADDDAAARGDDDSLLSVSDVDALRSSSAITTSATTSTPAASTSTSSPTALALALLHRQPHIGMQLVSDATGESAHTDDNDADIRVFGGRPTMDASIWNNYRCVDDHYALCDSLCAYDSYVTMQHVPLYELGVRCARPKPDDDDVVVVVRACVRACVCVCVHACNDDVS